MKKIMSILFALCIALTAVNVSEASWLSRMLDKIGPNIEGSADSINTLPSEQKSSRWAKISENQYFVTYVDKRSLQASGKAQSRKVSGYFKKEYTPVGSAWL